MTNPAPIYGDQMLADFQYEHLPPHLQAVSKPFCELARGIVVSLPRCPERTVALRKLLEAKDAAVRCALPHNKDFPNNMYIHPIPDEWETKYKFGWAPTLQKGGYVSVRCSGPDGIYHRRGIVQSISGGQVAVQFVEGAEIVDIDACFARGEPE